MVRAFVTLFGLACLIACSPESDDPGDLYPDWTDESHGNNVDPNYDVVFTQNSVNTLEITMTSSNWSAIQKDMVAKFGAAFGSGNVQGGGGAVFATAEPDYVPVSFKFNGIEWYNVGFRLKGNSTLSNAWRNGNYKLPFRLNFDEYEDDYPELKNQRFYGFKELSMSPGANDNSLIREKLGSEIFRQAGVPCSQTAFYKVYIDFGNGKKYCGVYTMVEVVDDSMIQTQFGDDKGNIYKPESTFQFFSLDKFEKKNNETENDYSDVQKTVAALNSPLRTTNPAQWRATLESTFNVESFIKWLAVNTTMTSWDTYGTMAHNYYLYNQAGKGLTWIPWDNNEVMLVRNKPALSLPLTEVTNSWPLIRYVLDDAEYNARYKAQVRIFTESVFRSDNIDNLIDTYHNLISSYVVGPDETEVAKHTFTTPSGFNASTSELKAHVSTRIQAAVDYLK